MLSSRGLVWLQTHYMGRKPPRNWDKLQEKKSQKSSFHRGRASPQELCPLSASLTFQQQRLSLLWWGSGVCRHCPGSQDWKFLPRRWGPAMVWLSAHPGAWRRKKTQKYWWNVTVPVGFEGSKWEKSTKKAARRVCESAFIRHGGY